MPIVGATNRSVKLTLGLCFSLIYASFSFANPVLEDVHSEQKQQQIVEYFQQLVKLGAVKGVAVSVVHGEQQLVDMVAGVQSDGDEMLRKDTALGLGSVSKPLLAFTVMNLVNQQRIRLEQPVSDFLPELNLHNPFDAKPVLIQHLLQHRSGLSTSIGNQNQAVLDVSSSAIATAANTYKSAILANSPGEKFVYSNANYQILAYVVEVVTGSRYEQALSSTLLSPLGMQNTYSDPWKQPKDSVSSGFQKAMFGYQATGAHASRTTLAQGGVYSSVNDMTILLKAILAEDEVLTGGDFQRVYETGRELPIDYGYGWLVRNYQDQKLVFHFGQTLGFESVIAFFPQLDLGFVVLANTQSAFGQTNVTDAIGNLLPIIFNQPLNANAPNTIDKSIYYLLNICFVLIAFWAVILLTRLFKRARYGAQSKPQSTMLFSVVNMGLVLFVYVLLIMLPEFNQVNLMAIKLFEPNIYFTILATSLLVCTVLACRVFNFFSTTVFYRTGA